MSKPDTSHSNQAFKSAQNPPHPPHPLPILEATRSLLYGDQTPRRRRLVYSRTAAAFIRSRHRRANPLSS